MAPQGSRWHPAVARYRQKVSMDAHRSLVFARVDPEAREEFPPSLVTRYSRDPRLNRMRDIVVHASEGIDLDDSQSLSHIQECLCESAPLEMGLLTEEEHQVSRGRLGSPRRVKDVARIIHGSDLPSLHRHNGPLLTQIEEFLRSDLRTLPATEVFDEVGGHPRGDLTRVGPPTQANDEGRFLEGGFVEHDDGITHKRIITAHKRPSKGKTSAMSQEKGPMGRVQASVTK